MPLKNYFQEQIDLLRYLLVNPKQRARCVRLTPVFMKMLAGLERDENNPHLMLCCEAPFDNYPQYFEALLRELNEELLGWQEPLRAAGRFPTRSIGTPSPTTWRPSPSSTTCRATA